MKIHKYSSFIEIDESYTLIYNSFTDSYVAIKDRLNNLMNSFDTMSEANREALIKTGVLVEDDVDEVEELKLRFNKNDNESKKFHIHVNPTLNCNFRCWYCYEDHSGTTKMPAATVNSIVKFSENQIQSGNIDSFTLSFFGGEPLLYFREIAKPLIERLSNICKCFNVDFDVQFTTNGFLLNEEVIKFLENYKVHLQITLDGPRDKHNIVRYQSGTGSYDVIVNNIKNAIRHNIYVILRINYTKEIISRLLEVKDDLKNVLSTNDLNNISIDFQQVWQDSMGKFGESISDDLNEVIKLFKSAGFNCFSPMPGSAANNSCYGDKRNHVLFNYNGDVYFCTARNFDRKNRAGVLNNTGEIVWLNNSLERHMSVKFLKKCCHECRIAPICGGGCRQLAKETAHMTTCSFGYTDEDIDKIILHRFERLVMEQ